MSKGTLRIAVRNLGKDFVRHHGHATAVAFARRLFSKRANRDARYLKALDGVNFEVREGELVGMIGNNGAGKTTLLRLIAGIYSKTRGEVEVNGEIALLSGLGVGMLQDLSVRENIYLYGAICRMHRAEIHQCYSEIVSWAELEGFQDSPLRTLSTGMQSRLAFSITTKVRTPIILMDEAFSAGDERFRQRCEDYFEQRRRDADCAMLIASHSLEFIERFCAKTLWLRYGEQAAFGRTSEVLAAYREWSS